MTVVGASGWPPRSTSLLPSAQLYVVPAVRSVLRIDRDVDAVGTRRRDGLPPTSRSSISPAAAPRCAGRAARRTPAGSSTSRASAGTTRAPVGSPPLTAINVRRRGTRPLCAGREREQRRRSRQVRPAVGQELALVVRTRRTSCLLRGCPSICTLRPSPLTSAFASTGPLGPTTQNAPLLAVHEPSARRPRRRRTFSSL